MSILVVPTDTVKLFWDQTTTLDGTAYLLTFRYNSRESCYYLMVQSADSSITYAQGIKLVANYPLLRGYTTPPGEFMVVSTSSNDSPPQLGELGDGQRCSLLYIEASTVFLDGGESWRNPEP
jgi:uncharacterized protein DUF6983